MKKQFVEGLLQQQIRVPMSATRFDPHLARVDVAVKAIWQLYRWERWELLESLGVERKKYERVFQQFDEECISSDHGLIESPSHVKRLIQMAGPGFIARALEVVERYQMMTKGSRNEYYQNRTTIENLDE